MHQKLTTNTKLVEGMKAGLKPDLSDDEVEGENEVYKSICFYKSYLRSFKIILNERI